SRAMAPAAMPARRSSIGTTSQPASAAYLMPAATPNSSTSTPSFTGTLPSKNQALSRRAALVTRSGSNGVAGMAGARGIAGVAGMVGMPGEAGAAGEAPEAGPEAAAAPAAGIGGGSGAAAAGMA